jgi:hypothetical protein
MDLQTVLQVVADFQAHQWWPLALLLVLWARKVLSADSSFRLNVPPRALHLVTASLTMVTVFVTAMVNATPIGTAALGALVAGIGAGFADGLLAAFFADPSNVPRWAKTIVMLVDELEGPPPAPVAQSRGFSRVGLVGALSLVFVIACGFLQSKVPSDLADDAKCVATQLQNGNTDPVSVGLNCGIQEGATLTDLIAYVIQKLGDKVPSGTRTAMGHYVSVRRSGGEQ